MNSTAQSERLQGQIVVKQGEVMITIRRFRNELERKKVWAIYQEKYKHNDVTISEHYNSDFKPMMGQQYKLKYLKESSGTLDKSSRHIRNASMLWWEWQNAGKCEQWASRFFNCRAYQLTKEQIEHIYNSKDKNK